MAYNSNINYAADLDYLMRTGAVSAATVNRLLNERMEKQQAAGENIYDDVYRRAMAYLLNSGQDLVASDNVDYAAAANNILAGDAAQDGYYETLAAVLAQRDAKLGSGSYGEWKDAKTDDGYAYNGDGSLAEIMADYLMGKKLAGAQTPYLSGGYVNPGFGFDEYGNVVYDPEGMAQSKRRIAEDLKAVGYTEEAIAAMGYGDAIEGGGTAYGTSGTYGTATRGAGYTPREVNELRRAARDNVGVTNAGTRAPVQGENSSYVEATTRNAYRDGLAALRDSGDSRGAAALEADRANYEKTGRVGKVTMPEEAERGPGTITGGGYGGASASSGSAAAADTAQEEETPAASFRYSAAAYSPVGYETWLADILSQASPGAVYDEESRRRGAGNLYQPAVTAPSFGGGEKTTMQTGGRGGRGGRPSVRAPGGPQEIAFNDTYADPAYDEDFKGTYIIGYGPANEAEIQAMDAMGKLKATYDAGGRVSFVYDTTPKYRRYETRR